MEFLDFFPQTFQILEKPMLTRFFFLPFKEGFFVCIEGVWHF
jgi:hypothetical protein